MTNKEAALSHDNLVSVMRYDAETGNFYWLVKRRSHGRQVHPGDLVRGTPNPWGYKVIGINRKRYIASRLAWFYVHKTWPTGEVDHANMDINDNRICNLRDAGKKMQRGNQRVRRDSKSGIKGVGFLPKKNKWRARCCQKTLGEFRTKEEAIAAYREAAAATFGEFARFE